MEKRTPKTREEAVQYAVDFQQWASEQNEIGKEPTLYTSDLIEWCAEFEKIAEEFDLVDEFKENGII